MTLTVLIADDQELVRAGFRMILDAEPDIEVVGMARDGAEAVHLVRRLRPQIVLMDIQMPGVDGLEATRQISAAGGGTRVLVLTTFDRDEYVYDALRAGASGFVLKDVPSDHLVSGLRAVAVGDALLSPAITRRLIETFVRGGPHPLAAMPRELDTLTGREHEVLALIARGLSNREIAADLGVSSTTVKTHVARVLGKLDLRDRVQAVVFAYEAGIVTPRER